MNRPKITLKRERTSAELTATLKGLVTPDEPRPETQPGAPTFDGADAWNAQPPEHAAPFGVCVAIKHPDATVPTYGSAGAGACDLYARLDSAIGIKPGGTATIGTGIAVAVPAGYAMFIYARSGLGARGLRPSNCVGVIDSDYRGEVMVVLRNDADTILWVRPGDRIAQATFERVERAAFEVVEALPETARGEGGFGSTGR